MSAKLPSPRRFAWRPSFDDVTGKGWFCFREPAAGVQPVKRQFLRELKHLIISPCEFTQGTSSWREIYATSSVKCIPAVLLLALRWVCAVTQLGIMMYIHSANWRMIYFFTTWTDILVTVYFLLLSLCSTVAIFRVPSVSGSVARNSMQLKHSLYGSSLPVPLRLVECVSNLVVGAAFVTSLVFWTAIYPNATSEAKWSSYYEHLCFLPVFIMAVISRIPYRLQRFWLPLLLGVCYDILCCVVAFVPLTTCTSRRGYMYSVMNYQKQPVKAWILTAVLSFVLPPASYIVFWFVLRFNNPEV